MRNIGIVCNTGKQEALEAAARLIPELERRGMHLMVSPDTGRHLGRADLVRAPYPDGWDAAELVVVLGGDGTLLRTAKELAPLNLPVLGVNTGHLGFLTEVESADMLPTLDEFLAGRWHSEERMMLRARVLRDGEELYCRDALNDAVMARGPLARMVHFTAHVGGVPVADYAADGVIVSTPTGSTAYSLSAGGPVLHPHLQVLLLTPICPHTFNARSLVVPGDESVSLRVHNQGEVLLSLDGQLGFRFEPGDVVVVERAPAVARLVRRSPFSFYDVLRRKLAEPYRKIGTSFGI